MFKNLCPGAVGIQGETQDVFRLAAQHGFGGADLNVEEAADALASGTIDEYQEAFRQHGLAPGGWGLPVQFRTDEAAFASDLAKLPSVASAAAAMGCPRAYTWVLPFSDERPYKEQFELLRDRFRRIAEILAVHGCRLGLEFVGPKTSRQGHRYEFIYRMDQMLEMCTAVGTGNVGLLLDAWHWYTSGGTVEAVRALRNEDVVYVHINDAPAGVPVDEQIDSVRRLPGETGVIDTAGFLQALQCIGYDGPVTPEPFVPELAELPAEEAARRVGESLAAVWAAAGL